MVGRLGSSNLVGTTIRPGGERLVSRAGTGQSVPLSQEPANSFVPNQPTGRGNTWGSSVLVSGRSTSILTRAGFAPNLPLGGDRWRGNAFPGAWSDCLFRLVQCQRIVSVSSANERLGLIRVVIPISTQLAAR